MSRGKTDKPEFHHRDAERSTLQRQRLIEIAEPVCEDAGFELLDLRFVRGRDGWVVEVFIDHPEREGDVGLGDCERVSRELSAVFDVEDPIPQAYRLEVSSPGLDRVLRKPKHFRRHVDERVKVTLREEAAAQHQGRRNYSGRLVAVEGDDAESLVVIEVDGQNFRLPISGIATARLVPDWDALMGKHPRAGAQLGRQ